MLIIQNLNIHSNSKTDQQIPTPMTTLTITPARRGKRWSEDEVNQLLVAVAEGKTRDQIATAHQRTVVGIVSRLKQIACDMTDQKLPMTEIILATRLLEIDIREALQQRDFRKQNPQVRVAQPQSRLKDRVEELERKYGELLERLGQLERQRAVVPQ